MKLNFHFSVLLLIVLIFSSNISARFISTKEGQEEVQLKEITDSESMNQLMGMEICENEDEECLKRRMTLEAHLDYIYTQHHKP